MSTSRQFYTNIIFLSTTDTTNTSTGSVQISGGLSIQKNVNIAGNLTVSNIISTNISTINISYGNASGLTATIPNLVNTNISTGALTSTNISTGALISTNISTSALTSINVLASNVSINTTSPSPNSILTLNGGNSIGTTSQANIVLSYTQGYNHFINSRHNNVVGSNQNSVDFYLNNSSTATGSTAPNFGNVNSMSITATGIGIFNSSPSNSLTVQSLSDIPSINPDAFNSLIISEDQQQTTLRSGITQGSLSYSQYTGGTTGYIQLTPATTSTYGQYYWNINPGNAFTSTFDHLAGGGSGGGSGGDNIFFFFYSSLAPSTTNANTNGYNITFSEYNGNISLAYNGTVLISTGISNFGNNTWHTSTITFFRNNIRVIYDGQLVINYLDTTNRDITTLKNYMGYASFCGAATNNHRIKNIRISKFSEGLFQFTSPTSGNAYYSGGGNIGIGTNNPSSTLDVNGNIRINFSSSTMSNRITTNASDNSIYTSNTVGNYSLMWPYDQGSTNGAPMCYLSAYGGQRFFTAGLPRMLIDGNGNIGINTTGPGYTLDVAGTFRATALNSNTFSPPHTLINTGTSQPSVLSLLTPNITVGNYNTTFFGQSLSNGNSGQLSFYYNGPNNTNNGLLLSLYGAGVGISLNNNGNVGINTTSSAYNLDVNGSGRFNNNGLVINNVNSLYTNAEGSSNAFQIYSSNGITTASLYMGADSTNNICWVQSSRTGAGLPFCINPRNAGGNVGINTPSPQFAFDVNGTGRFTGTLNLNSGFTVNSNTASSLLNFSPLYIAGDTNHYIRFANATNFNFSNLSLDGPVIAGFTNVCLGTTGGGQKASLIVNSSQQVGIGGISPSYTLDVNGSVNLNKGLTLTNKLLVLYDGNINDNITSGFNFHGFGVNSGTLRYQVNQASETHRFYCGSTSYYTITSSGGANVSDKRYKSEIINIENAIDKIKQLQGITFKMENIEKRQMGFLAQDVKIVIPEVVQVSNTETEKDLHYLSYDKLVPLLTEGIKEQQKMIDKLINFINNKYPNELIL